MKSYVFSTILLQDFIFLREEVWVDGSINHPVEPTPRLQTWLNSLADQHQSLSTERHGKTEAEAAGYKQ
jgi:hypothetical protein